MLEVNVVKTLDTIFEAFCKADCRPEFMNYMNNGFKRKFDDKYYVGIAFCLDVSMEHFGYEKDGITRHADWCSYYRTAFHVVYLNPHYIFVAEPETNEGFAEYDIKKVPLTSFENVSNHNSCWRNSANRFINSRLQEIEKSMMEKIPKRDRKKTNTPHVYVFTRPISAPFMQYVKAKLIPKEDGYHYSISEINTLNFKVVLEGME